MKNEIPPSSTSAPTAIATAAPPPSPLLLLLDAGVVGLTIGAGAVVVGAGVAFWGTPGLNGLVGLDGLIVGTAVVVLGVERGEGNAR